MKNYIELRKIVIRNDNRKILLLSDMWRMMIANVVSIPMGRWMRGFRLSRVSRDDRFHRTQYAILHDCPLLAATGRGFVYEIRAHSYQHSFRCCVPWEIENTRNSVDAVKRDNVSPECESDPLSVAAGC